jgi:hypothetical protein
MTPLHGNPRCEIGDSKKRTFSASRRRKFELERHPPTRLRARFSPNQTSSFPS